MSQAANPHAEPILERMTLEPAGKHLRAVFGGEVIAESADALVLSERGYPPRIYFPPEGLRKDRLEPTDHATSCPWKGTAAYWTVSAGGGVSPSATISGIPPTLVATTGSPAPSASRIAIPRGSLKDARANTSASPRYGHASST